MTGASDQIFSAQPDPEHHNGNSHPSSSDTTQVSLSSMPWLREDIEDAPFWKEVVAFNQLPQTTIDEHYGRYVAVYQGNIVDSDADEGELALRFYRTFGYVPVYIHKVGTEEGLVEIDD
ncbi:hypothetical protein CCAX7_49910 [Capsulimonas corticalis]|uniref:Uncharacterized protein n=1 Tax=Capsulimonas corticalis TaxID=2219043 RepID=A0A402CPT3_9BACT|nr:hypothetical protein [Capsulimonas corticalis]BDI32940.1 hypothetical protein CCAX7_49910 [Capsulimonas corticalis]